MVAELFSEPSRPGLLIDPDDVDDLVAWGGTMGRRDYVEEEHPRDKTGRWRPKPHTLYLPPPPLGADPEYTTEDAFSHEGVWDGDRVRDVHEQILADIAAQGAPVVDSPGVYMTGGGFGSGKSTLLDTFPGLAGFPVGAATRVDPDAIKLQIPEFLERVALGDKTAASYVHEESSYLAKRALYQSIRNGHDTIYDTSGDSGIGKLADKVQQMRDHGAQFVHADYVTPGSFEEAISRVNERAKNAGSRRREIPAPAVIVNHAAVSRTYQAAAARGTFDRLRLWSSDVPLGTRPFLVAVTEGGSTTVYDQAAYNAFLAMGGGE